MHPLNILAIGVFVISFFVPLPLNAVLVLVGWACIILAEYV